MAQTAGLRLRGGFSITTSPALERAGRGAAPRASEARAGLGGWGGSAERRHFGPRAATGARARRGRHLPQLAWGPHPAGPSGLRAPYRPAAPASRQPWARVPGSQSSAPASVDPCPSGHRPPRRGPGLTESAPPGPGSAPPRAPHPRGWSARGCGCGRAAAAWGGAPRRQLLHSCGSSP